MKYSKIFHTSLNLIQIFKYQFRIPELKPTSIVLPDHVVMSNTINTQ